MKFANTNFDNQIWIARESKNGEDLTIYLPKPAIDIIKKRLNQSANKIWVFESKTSKSGHYQEPKRAWKTLLKKANIEDLRIHDLRRTLGSYQAINGTSLQIIGKSLGQKSIKATQIYSRLTIDPVKKSVDRAIENFNVNSFETQ